jgi:drug/metabolite transporter (DMT)-like permease
MRQLFRRFDLIQVVFLSAVFYAAIPVIMALGSPELARVLPTFLPFISGLIALPALASARMRAAVLVILRSWRTLGYFVGNAATFVASLVLLSIAIRESSAPTAILIVESWPLFTALLLAPMLGQSVRKLNKGEFFWGVVAVLGIGLALKPDGNLAQMFAAQWVGILAALGSAALMGAAVGFKAWCTRWLKAEHNISPIGGYFVMQVFFLPLALLALPFLPLPQAQTGAAWIAYDDLGLVGLIVGVNTVSSVLFSYATLRMRQASDTYLWFFAPAISFGLYALIGPQSLRDMELLGLTFVVSANLISAIRDDTSLSFRALIVSLLAVGSICFLWPLTTAIDGYFEVLSVLSIFFVILLSFALDWSQRQREGMAAQIIALRAHIATGKDLRHGLCDDLVLRLDRAQHRSVFRRAVLLLEREFVRAGDATGLALLNTFAAIWRNDLRIGYFVALGAILIASVLIGLGARGDHWVYDLFATIYLSAMVFVFFFLIETVQDRSAPLFARRARPGWGIDLPTGRRVRMTTVWTLALSLFVLTIFAVLFVQPR